MPVCAASNAAYVEWESHLRAMPRAKKKKGKRASSSTEYGGDFNLTWPPREGVGSREGNATEETVQNLKTNETIPPPKRRRMTTEQPIKMPEAMSAQPMNDFAARMQREGKTVSHSAQEVPEYMRDSDGSAARAKTSSLFRALDNPPARDRWELMDPQLGPELGKDDLTGEPPSGYQRLGPPLTRAYLANFLRPPRRQRGERACCAGNECQGVLMHQRSHYHRYGTSGFVLRELLMPEEERQLTEQGKLPEQVGYCVVCTRFLVSRWCKIRNMTGSGNFSGLLCSHSVTVDVDGEYDSTTCLYANSLTAGIDRWMPEHSDNRYSYTTTPAGESQLEEPGYLLQPRHLN